MTTHTRTITDLKCSHPDCELYVVPRNLYGDQIWTHVDGDGEEVMTADHFATFIVRPETATALVHQLGVEAIDQGAAAEASARMVSQYGDRNADLSRQIHNAEREVEQFKRFVVQAVIEWREGCSSGKRQFIEEGLGLDWPKQRVVLTVTLDVPAGQEDEEMNYAIGHLRNHTDWYDDASVVEFDWETA